MNDILQEDFKRICDGLGELKNKLAGKRILITGALGFLGQHFYEVLNCLNENYLDEKCEVVLLDNFSVVSTKKIPQYKNFSFFKKDICKQLYFDDKIDFIINCAGIASPYHYNLNNLNVMDLSYMGSKNIFELAIKHNAKVLAFSSSEVYATPDQDNVPTKETYVGNVATNTTRSAYDVGKLMLETLSYVYTTHNKANIVLCRPFNFVGPLMSKTDFRVLPNFISAILENKPIKIFGNGEQTRTFCYITDAIEGCFRVLLNGKSGEVYNIGNEGPEVSMLDLVQTLEKTLDIKIEKQIELAPDTYKKEPLRRCPNLIKAKQELGYLPKVSLEEGLTRFYNWAKDVYK